MKKKIIKLNIAVLLILILCIGLTSCSVSPEQDAQNQIKSRLDSTLLDPKSFDPIEYSKLIPINDSACDAGDKYKGYLMILRYRSKNNEGNLQMTTTFFYFDKNHKLGDLTFLPQCITSNNLEFVHEWNRMDYQ